MNAKTEKPAIGVLGLWHLGLVYSSVLANVGFKVTGYDLNGNVVENLMHGKVELFEPGLRALVNNNLKKRLNFSISPEDAIKNKKFIFVCLDIPVNSHDQANFKNLYKLFDLIVKFCSPNAIIVISSQIPVGTSRFLLKKLKSRHSSIEVIYFPENLKIGDGINIFTRPERLILGSDSQVALYQFKKSFNFFHCKIIKMSLESAEMAKHALNSYLALNISFSSEMADICELVNANMKDVVKALKSDSRVSTKAPINPGVGFAGGTLGRDIQYLLKTARIHGYNAKLINVIYEVNNDRLTYLLKRITMIFPKLTRRSIGLLGLTYKPFTNTLRNSLSIRFANQLIDKGAHIRIFDPSVGNEIKMTKQLNLKKSINEFFYGLDIAIVMTEWPEFRNIDIRSVSALMKKKIIFDTKNFLDGKEYIKNGFSYYDIGN